MREHIDDEIPMPFDGFQSQQKRDLARNKAIKEAIKKQQKRDDKMIRALQIEQENGERVKKVAEKDREIYEGTIKELLGDIKNLVEIIQKNPDITVEDLETIEALEKKLTEVRDNE